MTLESPKSPNGYAEVSYFFLQVKQTKTEMFKRIVIKINIIHSQFYLTA